MLKMSKQYIGKTRRFPTEAIGKISPVPGHYNKEEDEVSVVQWLGKLRNITSKYRAGEITVI